MHTSDEAAAVRARSCAGAGGARAADGTKKNQRVESTILHATNGIPTKRAHGVILM